jgi:hypothetical protein
MMSRIENIACHSLEIFFDRYGYGSPSTTNSSSSRSRPQTSLLGGSWRNLSTPRSRSTAAQSPAYSIDVAASPLPPSMAHRSMSQPGPMGPPMMGVTHIGAQGFVANATRSQTRSDQRTHNDFHPNTTANLGTFEPGPFVGNGLGNGDPQREPFNINPDTNFFASQPAPSMNATSFEDITWSSLNPMLDSADDNAHAQNLADLTDYNQYENTRDIHYHGSRQ